MLQPGLPVGVGVEEMELVGSLETLVAVMVVELVVGQQHGGLDDEVGASLVEGHGVGRGEDSEIGHHGGVVVVPAVALGADVHDEADVEVRLVLEHGLRVFGNLVVEACRGVPRTEHGAVVLAEGHALAASHASGIVDHGLVVAVEAQGAVGAVPDAYAAAYAVVAVNLGLRGTVELELTGDAGGPHAEVLERAAESGLLMTLEMRHAYHDVGVGHGGPNLRRLAVFAVYLNLAEIGALEAVSNDHLALGRDRVEAVLHRALEMVNGVGATPGIEGVAVRQERLCATAPEQVGHTCREVWADIRHVSRLAEMDLDGDETVLQGKVGDSGAPA